MEIALLKDKIIPILKKSGVRRAALFGSVAKRSKKPNDVDILIDLDSKVSLLGFVNLKRSLEEILDQKVGLVEYNTIKKPLEKSILETQVNLFD